MPELEGMMTAEQVADVVLYAVTRPRSMRLMTVAFRPMSEGSWG
jgi:3-oxoacyl-[acyl-carrier protein] reductase